MHRAPFMILDAAIAAGIMAPLFLFLQKNRFQNKRRTVLYFLFAVYLSGIYAVAGLPDICYIRFDPNINLRPFAYMFSDHTSSILNVALFLPMGFFLPLMQDTYRPLVKTLLFGFCASCVIEIMQIFTLRATDINDLITNTLGTLLGWMLVHFLSASKEKKPDGNKWDIFLVSAIVFGVMFFIHPFIEELLALLF